MIKRLFLLKAVAGLLASAALSLSAFAAPAELDQGISALQNDWAVIQYQTPAKQREARFEALSQQAHALTARYATRAEPHIWEGIILSSWAGAKGGLGALGLAKQAKAEYETAIQIDSKARSSSPWRSGRNRWSCRRRASGSNRATRGRAGSPAAARRNIGA